MRESGTCPDSAGTGHVLVSVTLRYFAWVRERIGKTEEVVDLPPGIRTVGDLVTWLTGRGEEYAHAFENPKVVRAAIDRTHVRPDAALGHAREIAFFPPMTGG
jgi:molybdopterin synthase sulfur carrier subunit